MNDLKKTTLFSDMVTDESKDNKINEEIYDSLLLDSYDSFCDFFDEIKSSNKMYTQMTCEINNDKKIKVIFKISGKKKEKII